MSYPNPPPATGILGRGRWLAAVRDALEALIAQAPLQNGRPLATLDWDNTCIWGDVGEAALAWLDRGDGGDRLGTYERMVESHGKVVAYAWCATALAGMAEPALRDLAREVYADGLATGTIVEREEIRDLIWAMQRHGWEVWIVSASQETIVQLAAQRYGIPAERVIGIQLAIGPGGRFLPDVVGPVTFRAGKVDAIDLRIGRRPDLAVGDAETDVEMLQAAAHRLVIDRGDPLLHGLATVGRWWIQPAFEDR